MKKLLSAAAVLVCLAAAYVASPFVTVWNIREAIRSGDSAYLEHKLEWPTVRETLRASLTEYAVGPTPVSAPGRPAAQPGFWQRLKMNLGRRAVDNMVESYVTPDGLPQLFGMRQFYRKNVTGAAAATASPPWHERAAGFWQRIKRAVFHTPAKFEIEIADREDPTRHYVALLEMRALQWKLTELRLRTVPAPADRA
jgi:hypothetical protein